MTPLWQLAYELWKLGVQFTALGARVRIVAVFGDLLSAPFLAVAGILFDAANFCWDANGALLDIIAFVNRIRYDNYINDLIQRVFGYWQTFRTDPRGFVNDRLRELVNSWDDLRLHPGRWVWDRLYSNYPELRGILSDPLRWLRNQLEYNLGLGAGFFDDPLGAIRSWIGKRYPSIGLLFDSPTSWLRDQLTVRLGIDRDFLDSPRAWVWTHVREAIEDYAVSYIEWVVGVAADLINRAWDMKT